MVKITKTVGRVIQLYTVFLINGSLYFELFVSHKQPIYDMLEELGEYENQFNYITGWPCYFFASFYYYTVCLQSPGLPVRSWNVADPEAGRQCTTCKLAKPERCHHCTRCGVCVVKRDHHCDFTNQCVGAGNYKCFFWFTFAALIACCHPGLRLAQWNYHYYFLQDLESVNQCSGLLGFVCVVVMGMYFSMTLFTFTLTVDNFRNSFANCTRLDVMGEMDRPPLCFGTLTEPMNEYDLGMCRNWVSDFGWNPLLWWFPGQSTDCFDTYAAHRFGSWPLLSTDVAKLLKHTKLEKIPLGFMKRRRQVAARAGNLQQGWRQAVKL